MQTLTRQGSTAVIIDDAPRASEISRYGLPPEPHVLVRITDVPGQKVHHKVGDTLVWPLREPKPPHTANRSTAPGRASYVRDGWAK